MVTAQAVHPSELPAAERRTWLDLCAAQPAFSSPLLGPDFAEAVGAWREDARVAVFREDGRAVGFLPHHVRPSSFARPIGSPFSDYHALVSAPGAIADVRADLAAAGIHSFRFSGLIDPYGLFDGVEQSQTPAYRMDLGAGGADGYLEALRQANPKRFKNWRRLEHKLEREAGEIVTTAPDHSQEAFDLLLEWKRDQLRRTGLHDFFRPAWTQGLMQSLFERRTGEFQGMMLTVRAGGRLIAGHFGVRLNGVFHSWIASMDPDAGAWSPGQTLLAQAIPAMERAGLKVYDLGPSHGHYKAPFCNAELQIGGGLAKADAAGEAPAANALEQALTLASARSERVARLLRRLDHIAAIELSAGGRVRGVMEALAGQRRRVRAPQDSPSATEA